MSARILYACPVCGRTTEQRGRCASCPPARRALTTAQRGYGADHQRRRAALLHSAYGQRCPLCGELMAKGQALDLDHTIASSSGGVGDRMVHAICNRRRGKGDAS